VRIAMKVRIQDHAESVRRFFRRRLHREAEDLVQETMLAGMQAIDRFRGDAGFETFVLRIAQNLLRARYREITREHLVMVEAGGVGALEHNMVERGPVDFPTCGEVSSPLFSDRMEKALNEALSDLSSELKAVIDLVYWKRFTQDEAARVLGVPPGTVASRLRRARSQLREKLAAIDLE